MGRRPLRPGGGAAEGSTLQKDKIVEDIALSMSSGEWHPHRSVREFAARLGMSLSNAQRYAADATRLLRMSWGQDEAKVAVIERIAMIGRAAENRTEGALDAKGEVHELRKPDHRTALQAAKHLADMLGMSGTNNEVVVRYQQMSDADLWREVQSFAARLQGKTHDGIETSGEEIPDEGGDERRARDEAALDGIDAEVAE
jgi:hypothetical protein